MYRPSSSARTSTSDSQVDLMASLLSFPTSFPLEWMSRSSRPGSLVGGSVVGEMYSHWYWYETTPLLGFRTRISHNSRQPRVSLD